MKKEELLGRHSLERQGYKSESEEKETNLKRIKTRRFSGDAMTDTQNESK